jgi:hypothetical protein
MTLPNFPKIECPLIRKQYAVNLEDFKRVGRFYNLRTPRVYLAVDQINPGYEWVFDDPDTFAVEKLDGTNIAVQTELKYIKEVYNRENKIDLLKVIGTSKGNLAIIEGILSAISKGRIPDNSLVYGELIGPHINNNMLHLDKCTYYPFDYCVDSFRYKSFDKYPRTFVIWSNWFKEDLRSLCYTKEKKCMHNEAILAEGVIFYNLKRKEQGLVYRAKLRRDMFSWYYTKDIRIIWDEDVETK